MRYLTADILLSFLRIWMMWLEWSAARVTDELVRAGRDTADMRSAIEIFADSFSEKYSVLKKLMDSAKRSGIEKNDNWIRSGHIWKR